MDREIRRRRGDADYPNDKLSAQDLQEQEKDAELVARSSRGWTTFFIAFAAAGIVLAGVIALLPSPIQPVAFSLPPPPAWTGPLEPNDKLTNAERILENQVKGAESVVRDGAYIYTGTSDGRVVSIYKGEVRTLARFGTGEMCESFENEPACGRPLGMRMDSDGYLLVADAYLGIFRVNVATGDVYQVLSTKYPLAGKQSTFLNDILEGENGTIYFTESSTHWQRRHNRYCIMEGDISGRLMSFNPETLHVEELVSGLAFPNGITLSYDHTSILMVETTKARILRYDLKGPYQGETEVFVDNLPGWPDNIRQSGRGTYWVGMASIRRADQFSFLDFAAPYPWIRSLFTKLLSQEALMSMIPKYGLLVELDKDGNIIRTLHDPTGKQVPDVSEAEEKNGVLYLGSYHLPFLSRVYLHKK